MIKKRAQKDDINEGDLFLKLYKQNKLRKKIAQSLGIINATCVLVNER